MEPSTTNQSSFVRSCMKPSDNTFPDDAQVLKKQASTTLLTDKLP